MQDKILSYLKQEKQQLQFVKGIYGFENHKQFELYKALKEPFMYLSSKTADNIRFILLDPFSIFHYNPLVSLQDEESLALENTQDGVFLVIVNTAAGGLAVNLKSPILFNPKNGFASQVILLNEDYAIRHYLIHDKQNRMLDSVSSFEKTESRYHYSG